MAALFGCALIFWGACCQADPPPNATATEIHRILSDGSAPDLNAGELDLPALRAFYAREADMPVWSGTAAAEKDSRTMLAAFDRADEDGLDPAQYRGDEEFLRHAPTTPLAAAEFDIRMTDAALRFARDLRLGRPEARTADRDVELPADGFDPPGALSAALKKGDLESFLAELAPPQADYARLKDALRRYRAIAADGGWPILPEATAGQYAEDGSLADLLHKRLLYEDASATASDEASRADAVKRFQAHHGLDADGQVGKKTQQALNVPALERVLEITANMERWRWLPRAFEPSYVAINVPDARLNVVENGEIVLTSRVIVGRKRGPTPILRAVATAVTVNPPWNVPAPIARKEILPKLKKNPDYLASEDMILVDGPPEDPNGLHVDWRAFPKGYFPYRVRQLPGPKNALGRIKLELPNRFDVYLHDTPGQAAFELNERYLSHGCVRVQEIMGLASYALAGDTTSAVADLTAAVEAGATAHLQLSKPLPIYFLYWTAFVDDDGSVEFRDDIYGRDRRLLDAIARHPTRQSASLDAAQCFPA